ncbi:MAG: glycoside hydrolase family 5 protein [Clostridiales bacterium]|jgi:endoglucanase|nr:glycoside hydrolase family 5 protein [Clostridiales bacterium]
MKKGRLIKRIFISFLLAVVAFSSAAFFVVVGFPTAKTRLNGDAFEFVSKLGVGMNLGNALEAFGDADNGFEFETGWGNAKVTAQTAAALSSAGFGIVRIPVTWAQHIGAAPDYTIQAAWLGRVREVVDYFIDEGMYVIINMHHDDYYWYIPDKKHEAATALEYKALWGQIAEEFKDYDEHLIFEAFNEPRVTGSLTEWSGGTVSARGAVNRLNQKFVDTVRASGGNNPSRYLIVPSYAASIEKIAVNGLTVPNDGRLIAAFHSYIPRAFSTDYDMGTTVWTAKHKKELEKKFALIDKLFIQKGVPVIFDEFAAYDKNNTEERAKFAYDFVTEAQKYNIPCLWWDNGTNLTYTADNAYGIFDRNTNTFTYPTIVDAIIRAAK